MSERPGTQGDSGPFAPALDDASGEISRSGAVNGGGRTRPVEPDDATG